MIPIKDTKSMQEHLKLYEDKRSSKMFGIMFARPHSLNAQFVKDNYQYWNEFSGKDFDIFWAGYGAYYNKDDRDKMSLISVEVDGLPKDLQFDINAFLRVKEEIKDVIPAFKYKDTYPTLVLVDYKKGKICYEDAIILNLVSDKEQIETSIYRTMESLIDLSHQVESVSDFHMILINTKNKVNITDKIFNLTSLFSTL
ncbi:hypothetical protein [Enterococcus sp. AZ072]|uniref:hypothetical protein n=1 Tax=unclassified Enterococcus TaxID=2608891 RepID=UPI003D29188C